MIHRYFDISATRTPLNYKPIVAFEEGWKDTVARQVEQRGVEPGVVSGGWGVFEQKQKVPAKQA